MEKVFNPFNPDKRMNWNLWIVGVTNLSHITMNDSVCLMLDRKTGLVYTKPANDVTAMEWNQASGHSAVIAVANESECF